MGCSEWRYHSFRSHLQPFPTSSIGGKVTAEQLLDDGGTIHISCFLPPNSSCIKNSTN